MNAYVSFVAYLRVTYLGAYIIVVVVAVVVVVVLTVVAIFVAAIVFTLTFLVRVYSSYSSGRLLHRPRNTKIIP